MDKQTIQTKEIIGGEIQEVSTRAFGVIDFKGSSRKAKAKFVQLSDETPAQNIFELLTHHWRLAEPKFLISIIGGAKLLTLSDDMKYYLFDGLRKMTFESQGTWILTGGTNTGIMKLVGENLQGICKSIIGIATWGAIENANTLRGAEKKIPLGGTFPYEIASSIMEKKTYLDHNHTHFLLADDASVENFGVGTKLCSKLIKYVVKEKEPKVPSVIILVNGGVYSLENVLYAVTDKPSIPVLIIKGSGRAADVLSYAIENKDSLNTYDYLELKDLIGQKMNLTSSDEKEFKNVFDNVLECVENFHMFSVVDPDDEEGIDKKILETILSSYNLSRDVKLLWTVLWNRVDVAHNVILQDFSHWQKTDLENAMTMALAMNRFRFVQYFIEQNIPLHKMLTKSYLEFLYGHRSTRKRSVVIKKSVERSESSFEHKKAFHVLKSSLNYYRKEKSMIVPYDQIFSLIQLLCEDMRLIGTEIFVTPPDDLEDDVCSEHAYRDIFLWAVLNNMQDMAKVFWKLGDEQVAKAIVAAHINNELASRASDENLPVDTVKMFKANAIEFENLALNVLNSCHSENIEKTKLMLTMELGEFTQQNCLSLAHSSYFEQFIAHTAVQQILKELWLGERKFENNLIQTRNEKIEENPKDDNLTLFRKSGYYSEEDGKTPLLPKNKENKKVPCKSKADLKHNYFNKAIGNFYKSLMSYCTFLVLLSYVAILEKNATEPGIVEIIVCIWVLSIAIEEIYQLIVLPAVKWKTKVKEYRSSIFNVIDFSGIVIFLIGFIMQLFSSTLQYGHLLYAIDAALWIMRLLQYFYANKILGPYVLMIGRMFYDMMYFISILGVFLLAHGVLTSAVLMPETNVYRMIVNAVHRPYFQIYGELFTDNDDSGLNYTVTDFGTRKLNSYSGPLAWIFLATFLLIANVLLLNLLIAIFGNTFEEVQEKSDEIWKYKRYDLITEYSLSLPLPPPFTIFALIWKISPMIWKKVMCKQTENKAEEMPNEKLIQIDIQRENVGQFQTKNAANVLRHQRFESQESFEQKKWEELSDMIMELKNEFATMKRDMKQVINK